MEYQLNAEIRTEAGKGAARKLRARGLVPAVTYGPGFEPVSLAVQSNELKKLLNRIEKDSTVFWLRYDRDGRKESKQVLIRELQVHPYRRRFLHIDFYAMPMDRVIDVEVPLVPEGEAVGVEKGGVVNQLVWTVNIRCLPGDIPENITVDVTELDVGDSIHIGAIADKYDVEFLDDESQAIITLDMPRVEEEEAPEEEEGEEAEAETEQGEEVTEE
jgi:large subunit ribosomal protein L25